MGVLISMTILGKRVHISRLTEKFSIRRKLLIGLRRQFGMAQGSRIFWILTLGRSGFSESSVKSSYLDKLGKRELMGSSRTLRALPESEKIWNIEPHIQLPPWRILQLIFYPPYLNSKPLFNCSIGSTL